MLLSFLKAKPDLNTTLPVRQTASIFKQPVTKVTNHPNNKVKTDPQKAVDQPKQVSQRREDAYILCSLNFIQTLYLLVMSGNANFTTETVERQVNVLLVQEVVLFCLFLAVKSVQ